MPAMVKDERYYEEVPDTEASRAVSVQRHVATNCAI